MNRSEDTDNLDYHLEKARSHLEMALQQSRIGDEEIKAELKPKWDDFFIFLFGDQEG